MKPKCKKVLFTLNSLATLEGQNSNKQEIVFTAMPVKSEVSHPTPSHSGKQERDCKEQMELPLETDLDIGELNKLCETSYEKYD